jgi:hypothetical protein
MVLLIPDNTKFQQALDKLSGWLETEQYKGYDPYDILLSYLPFRYTGKWISVLTTQIHKRNPLNLRPLLGIPKDYNPKAMGLFLLAYSLQYGKMIQMLNQELQGKKVPDESDESYESYESDESYEPDKSDQSDQSAPSLRSKMEFFFHWLLENSTPGFAGKCWGYNFPWAGPVKFMKANYPSGVVTGFIGRALFEYYRQTGDKEAIEALKSAGDFIQSDLHLNEDRMGLCFSYTPLIPDCCYNASLLSAELLAKIYSLAPDNSLLNKIEKAVSFVISRQKPDGRWNYSMDLKNGTERDQIDFHQGFILESLYEIRNYALKGSPEINNALKKGLEFYRKNQFMENGRAMWRLPANRPTDIHSQAQGIITFCKLKEFSQGFSPDYPEFAKMTGNWTIDNMQDKTGYFYYQVNRMYTNKIPYIRWAQAWMFLALTHLCLSD